MIARKNGEDIPVERPSAPVSLGLVVELPTADDLRPGCRRAQRTTLIACSLGKGSSSRTKEEVTATTRARSRARSSRRCRCIRVT